MTASNRRARGGEASGTRPNFVIIIPDQLRADALGCFGNPLIRTPNIDELTHVEERFRRELLRWQVETSDVLPPDNDSRSPAVALPTPGAAVAGTPHVVSG